MFNLTEGLSEFILLFMRKTKKKSNFFLIIDKATFYHIQN